MQAQTEQSVQAGRAMEGRERERERQEGGEERKRLHLLDAPALGSLPITLAGRGAELRCRAHTENWANGGKKGAKVCAQIKIMRAGGGERASSAAADEAARSPSPRKIRAGAQCRSRP